MASNSARRSSSRSSTKLGMASTSQPYVTQDNSLLLQDGPVNEDAAERLEEFVGTHDHHGTRLIGTEREDDEDDKGDEWKNLPWWKKPSPLWMLSVVPISAMAQSATLAPKIELYTMLACRVHKPDIFEGGTIPLGDSPLSMIPAIIPSILASAGQGSRNDWAPSSCVTDPTVQAAVAELSAAITTTMGVLSLLTTAWWGSFSDRKGRVPVMGISLIGLLFSDFNHINVYHFSKYLPGGYWFLLVGPVIEGILGGFSTGVAAIHAYLADTTTENTRARIFSMNLGLLFLGMAFGPTLGSVVVGWTGKTISIFYAAAFVHVLYAIFIWVILPESLSQKKMRQARLLYEQESNEAPINGDSNPTSLQFRLSRMSKKVFQFMKPLAIFLPDLRPNPNPLKKPKRDWSLTLLGIGYGFTISLMASYNYIFQYAAAAFSWSSVQLGYYLSIVGIGRAFFLAVILPIIIKLFKPKPLVIDIPAAPSEQDPLLGPSQSAKPPVRKELHSPSFELGIARVSLVIEFFAYGLMGVAPTGAAFAGLGLIAATGVGFSPAVQTCALAMYARRGGTETGRLFGAISVVQALSAQVLGPSVYGLVYMKTVAFFPRAIFFVAVASVAISLILFTFVRLPEDAELRREILAAYRHSEDDETGDLGSVDAPNNQNFS